VHGKDHIHYYPKNKAHICYNPTVLFGQIPETPVPLMLVFPSQSRNISKAAIDNMKESLSSLSDHHWINQSHCGTARQYLKELSMSKSLKKVNNQAVAVIQPYVMHVVFQHYKALTYFKVGAIRSCGVDSQYDLMGALHWDYHDNVIKKVPDKRPQFILMALDPFKLLYESNMGTGGLMDGKFEELLANRGQAIVFCSSFCHASGSNYSIDQTGYVYLLFAYIVLSESDYPSKVGTRVKH
jgi:hypothetical protein